MTIKISYPSQFSARMLRRRTGQFDKNILRGSDIFRTKNGAQMLVQKRNILLNFDSRSEEDIAYLRKYVGYLFQGSMVGVDEKNPITTDLAGVHEYIFPK